MPTPRDMFKPGDEVLYSGIYLVTHTRTHIQPHEVTCVSGNRFPACRQCQRPRFRLVRAATLITVNEYFRPQPPMTMERPAFAAE